MKMKGFTLIEVLIVMGISSVVGVLLLVIIFNSTGLFYQQSSKLSQGLGSNDALSKIRSTIRESSAIAVSYTAGSTTYTSSSSQLVLKVGSINATGNLISEVFDYFVFFSDPSAGSGQVVLRFKSFLDSQSVGRKPADQILSLNVDSILFQYYDLAIPPQEVTPTSASKIKITLFLKQKSGANYETSVASSEANLRND